MTHLAWYEKHQAEQEKRDVMLQELAALLRETNKFHLRDDEHRSWLERRDAALKKLETREFGS